MKYKVIYLLLIILTFLASCKSTKQTSTSIKKHTEVDSVYNLMHKNQVKADWLIGKFKGVYQMPEKQQVFNGQIRMKKDSIIWVSIYAIMNIEVFRLIIQPDSFKFINKLEKTYISESEESLVDYFGINVDFNMLQALILGNDFPYYETNNFTLNENANNYILNSLSRHKLKKLRQKNDSTKILVQSMFINKKNYRISKQKVKILGNNKLVLSMFYSDFMNIDNQLIASNWILKYKNNEKSYIEINFHNIKLNKPTKFPFRISSKYKRQTIH